MYKQWLFFLFILPLFSFSGLHKFYVSVTDIEYNTDTKALQIISRVFADDMEYLLRTRYSDEIRLSKEKEGSTADLFLEKYVKEKLSISVNGKKYPVNFLGKRYDKDQLVLYMEIEKIVDPRRIAVTNVILMDAFPDQKNIINIEKDGEVNSLLLTRHRQSGSLNLNQ